MHAPPRQWPHFRNPPPPLILPPPSYLLAAMPALPTYTHVCTKYTRVHNGEPRPPMLRPAAAVHRLFLVSAAAAKSPGAPVHLRFDLLGCHKSAPTDTSKVTCWPPISCSTAFMRSLQMRPPAANVQHVWLYVPTVARH
jgi:hypothetical protein